MDFAQLIERFGFPVAVAVYFLWKDHKRQKADDIRQAATEKRISQLEERYRTELADMVRQNQGTMQSVMRVLSSLVEALRRLRCMWTHTHGGDYRPHDETTPEPSTDYIARAQNDIRNHEVNNGSTRD